MTFTMTCDDAIELGQLLQFLDDWLAADHGPASVSLARFVGCADYDTDSLRADLARFAALLGASDDAEPYLHVAT